MTLVSECMHMVILGGGDLEMELELRGFRGDSWRFHIPTIGLKNYLYVFANAKAKLVETI